MPKGTEEFADNRERRSATVQEGRRAVDGRKALRRAGVKCARCRSELADTIDSTGRSVCYGCARVEHQDREIAAARRFRRATEVRR